ncbi:MAG: transporter substrate-binding domain-containing protein, partial [Alphaproteobacteria bacterium]|nr:transporter substrate-binding domain-containing protein [Alphaproteobacteria bacterium]
MRASRFKKVKKSALARGTLCLIALILSITAAGAPAQGTKAPQPGAMDRTVIAGVPAHWPPQYDQDKKGRPTGFAIDVMEGIAGRLELRLDYRVYQDFRSVSEAWERGEIDIIPNSGITPARRENALFTAPVETFVVSIFVRNGMSDITGPATLAGRRVSVVARNIGHSLLKERRDIDLVVHQDVRAALFDLLAGETDALVFPKPVLLHVARKIGVEGKIEALAPPLKELKRGIRVQKHEIALHAALNRAVVEFRNSPDYQAIYRKWYGAPEPVWSMPRLLWLMAGTVVVLVIVMAWWR